MAEIIAVIKNYKLGSRTQTPKQYVVNIEGYDRVKSSALLGKSCVWTSPAGKTITGKIASVHGDRGAVIAKFDKGLPGQALGTKLLIK